MNLDAIDAIDRQIVVDVKAKGTVPKLYSGMRDKIGKPLVLGAGRKIELIAENRRPACLLTGFPIPFPYPTGHGDGTPSEVHSDGPVGTALLAQVLVEKLGVPTFLVADQNSGFIFTQCLRAAFRHELPKNVSVIEFPVNKDINDLCAKFIEDNEPALFIASEKPSHNEKGVYHTFDGRDLTPHVAKSDLFFDHASKRGIDTIAVADLGNEIGMGSMREIIEHVLPRARKCSCPCGGSIIPSTMSEAVVLGTMADWGVYGLLAYIALSKRDPTIIPTRDQVESVMNACAIASGLRDWSTLVTDDISLDCTGACLQMLKHIVRRAII